MRIERLTPTSVSAPQQLSSGAEKFSVDVEEDFPGEIAIFSRRGAEDLRGHLGETVEVTLEEGRKFRGVPQFKIVRTPGWERRGPTGEPNVGDGRATQERTAQRQEPRPSVIDAGVTSTSDEHVAAEVVGDWAKDVPVEERVDWFRETLPAAVDAIRAAAGGEERGDEAEQPARRPGALREEAMLAAGISPLGVQRVKKGARELFGSDEIESLSQSEWEHLVRRISSERNSA